MKRFFFTNEDMLACDPGVKWKQVVKLILCLAKEEELKKKKIIRLKYHSTSDTTVSF